MGIMIELNQRAGSWPDLRDALKIIVRGKESSPASSFRSLGCSGSSPILAFGSRELNALKVISGVIDKSGIKLEHVW